MNTRKKIFDSEWVGIGLTIFFCVLFSALISFRGMPISEGWYTEYAWKINHGQLPYKDFEYLFFPLYMYFIAGFTKIFGYGIWGLRVLGILMFSCIGVVLYKIYSNIFNKYIGVVAAVLSAFYMQSESAQIFYDYIRLHDIFAVLATLGLVNITINIVKNIEKKEVSMLHQLVLLIFTISILLISAIIAGPSTKLIAFMLVAVLFIIMAFLMFKRKLNASVGSLLTGIFVTCEFLVKQSNGTVMICYVIAFYIIAGLISRDKRFYKEGLGTVVGIGFAGAVFLLYLLLTNSMNECFSSCFGNALAAKGGVSTILFGWIPKFFYNFNSNIILIVILVAVIAIIMQTKAQKEVGSVKLWHVIFLALITFAIISNSIGKDFYGRNTQLYNSDLGYISFGINMVALVVILVQLIYNKNEYSILVEEQPFVIMMLPLIGVAVSQGVGNAMSGGLAAGNTFWCVGNIIVVLLWLTSTKKAYLMEIAISLVLILMVSSFVAVKTNKIYSWWGLEVGSRDELTETTTVPLLKGIKLSESEKNCYETVYNDVTKYSDKDDSIYVFPHAPVFYTITDRHSETYAQVEWFDVSSMSAIQKDIETLRENNPKVIVYVAVPEGVYESHETLFSAYQTRTMRDYLIGDLIPNEGYEMVDSVDIGNEYYVQIYVK